MRGSRMLRTVLLRALDGKGEGDELGTARSISETSSTAPCATFVDRS